VLSGEFGGRPVNLLREFPTIAGIALVLERDEKGGELPLVVRVQRGQFLFQHFDAHGLILLPQTGVATADL